jgi:hypothetical protein
MQMNTEEFVDTEGEELAAAGGDIEYRQAKRVLRGKGYDVHPADSGTDSHVDGRRMTRDQVLALAAQQEAA